MYRITLHPCIDKYFYLPNVPPKSVCNCCCHHLHFMEVSLCTILISEKSMRSANSATVPPALHRLMRQISASSSKKPVNRRRNSRWKIPGSSSLPNAAPAYLHPPATFIILPLPFSTAMSCMSSGIRKWFPA